MMTRMGVDCCGGCWPTAARKSPMRATRGNFAGKLQTFNPGILVSDIGMPVSDGYDLIKEVRARGVFVSESSRHRADRICPD